MFRLPIVGVHHMEAHALVARYYDCIINEVKLIALGFKLLDFVISFLLYVMLSQASEQESAVSFLSSSYFRYSSSFVLECDFLKMFIFIYDRVLS